MVSASAAAPQSASCPEVKVRVQAPFQVQGRTGQDRDRVAEHAHAVVENDVVGAKPPFESGTVGRAVQLPDDVEGPAVEHSAELVDDHTLAFADGLALDVLEVEPSFRRFVDHGQRASADLDLKATRGGVLLLRGEPWPGPGLEEFRQLQGPVAAAEHSQVDAVDFQGRGLELAQQELQQVAVETEVLSLEPGIIGILRRADLQVFHLNSA